MANEKFTQLPTVTSSTLSDIIAAVQGGTSVQQTLQQVMTLSLAQTILHYAGNPNGNVAGNVYQFCWDTTGSVLYVCTTSGNAASAVWTLAGSISFPISMAEGGTGKALTADNGGIVYTDADSMEILASTGTARKMLQSGASAAPTWSTSTFADTYAASTLLYSNGANTVSGLATANSAQIVTNASGVPAWTSSMTNGQVVIGSTGATPVLGTLTAGANISITNAAGSITIAGTGLAGFSWTVVTGATQAMLSGNGYIMNRGTLITATLPATSAVGDEIDIIGKGAGGWTIAQNAGQTIVLGSSTTTTGVAGSLSSTNAKDSFYMICTVANTEWTIASAPQGNLTVV